MEWSPALTKQQWDELEAILLDMDGTLLDLAFDNDFWLRQVPRLYAEKLGIDPEVAQQQLFDLYHEYKGTLQWYCTDFWSDQLGIDIIKHKYDFAHNIALRPGTVEFLNKAKAHNKRLILVTNAHPDTLEVKMDRVLIAKYFDDIFSSHQFSRPKESPEFWERLQQEINVSLNKCLFVDDSEEILTVAQQSGVKLVLSVSQPDLSLPIKDGMKFPNINQLNEIIG